VFCISGATLTLLLAVNKQEIGVLQGSFKGVQPHGRASQSAWIVSPFAFVLSISIAGIASAWLSGSARIPFVAGPRSLLAGGFGQAAQEVCDALRRVDRGMRAFPRFSLA